MNLSATTTKRRHPLAALLRRLLALRHKRVAMQRSPFADAMEALTPQQKADLDELLHRGLRTWEQPPAWIVQWHDARSGIPAPMVQQVPEKVTA